MSLASIELNAATNRSLESSIKHYFACESTAQENCDVYRAEALKYTFHEVTDTACVLLGLFPLVNLIYAFDFGRWRKLCNAKKKANELQDTMLLKLETKP